MAQKIKAPKQAKKTSKIIEHGSFVYGFPYFILILIFSIPSIVALGNSDFDANSFITVMKFITLLTIPAQPLATAMYQGEMPYEFLTNAFGSNFPGTYEGRFAEVTDFTGTFQGVINVPVALFALPLILMVLGAMVVGYNTPKEKNVAVMAIRYSLDNYLGKILFFTIVGGIGGIMYGLWDFATMLTNIFRMMFLGWADLVLWIILSCMFVALGKLVRGKRKPSPEAAEYLVESLLLTPAPRVMEKAQRIVIRDKPPRVTARDEVVPKEKMTILMKTFCEFCGSKLVPGALYCEGCGVKLEYVELGPEEVKEIQSKVPEKPSETIVPSRMVPAPEEIETEEKVEKKKEPHKLKPEDIERIEKALQEVNKHSVTWAALFIGIAAVSGISSLFFGSILMFLQAIFSIPFGIAALLKDNGVFTKWVHERNYSSRGVDLIIWGAMGSICSGAGVMILVKGLMMLLITINRKEEYPKLDSKRWQARVFQAANTAAGPLVLLSTIAGLAQFAILIPLGIYVTATGIAVYFVYSRMLHPELVRGNLEGMDWKLILTGVFGCIAGGGGILILIQGILIAIQKSAKESPKPEEKASTHANTMDE
ncbi:MAG: hypothetical protein ACFFCS_25120 [Candidatus Hodarchaeota archaeon]